MTLIPGKWYRHKHTDGKYFCVGKGSAEGMLVFEKESFGPMFVHSDWANANLVEYKEPKVIEKLITVWEDDYKILHTSFYLDERSIEEAKKSYSYLKLLDVIPFKWTEKT